MNLIDSSHDTYMTRAIELAKRGLGRTFPNPSVGCVLVREGEIVGEGYHHRAGEPHAEIMALRSLPSSIDPSTCTLYVTLEPCCMQGRTPACTSAVDRAGIKRVVIGVVDPDPRVHGKGVALMRSRGVEVITGVCQDACTHLIRGFAKRILHAHPFIMAKWAMSLDGKIAATGGDSKWITSEEARARGHALRNEADAILVGKNTALHDDPRLTCRIEGGNDPVRVLIDAYLDVPTTHTMLQPGTSRAETIVLVGEHLVEQMNERIHDHIARLRAQDVKVMFVPTQGAADGSGRHHIILEKALAQLAARGLGLILVEGGGALLGALRDAHLIDEIHAFIAPKVIGGRLAPTALQGVGAMSMQEVHALEHVEIDLLPERNIYLRGELPTSMRKFALSW